MAFTNADLKKLKHQVANGVYIYDESIIDLLARLEAAERYVKIRHDETASCLVGSECCAARIAAYENWLESKAAGK